MQVNSTFLKKPLLKKGAKIKIKKSNKGKFTDYCGGKVTLECIDKGKHSPDPKIRKRATFALNARAWKHLEGGPMVTINGQKDLEYWKNYQDNYRLQFTDYLKKYQDLLEKAQQQLELDIQDALKKGSVFGKIGGMAMNSLNLAVVNKRDETFNDALKNDPQKKLIMDQLFAGNISSRTARRELESLGYTGPLTPNMFARYLDTQYTYTYDDNLSPEENKKKEQLFAENKKNALTFLNKNNRKQERAISERMYNNGAIDLYLATLNYDTPISVYPEEMEGYVESAELQFKTERETLLKQGLTTTPVAEIMQSLGYKKGGLISKKVHDPFHTKSILDDTGMVDRKTLKLKKHGR